MSDASGAYLGKISVMSEKDIVERLTEITVDDYGDIPGSDEATVREGIATILSLRGEMERLTKERDDAQKDRLEFLDLYDKAGARAERAEAALAVPEVWPATESLFAAAAWLLRHRLASLTREGTPTTEETPEPCIACDESFLPDDMVLPDESGGYIHVKCCGPERDGYTLNGEPLKESDPIPTGFRYGDFGA